MRLVDSIGEICNNEIDYSRRPSPLNLVISKLHGVSNCADFSPYIHFMQRDFY